MNKTNEWTCIDNDGATVGILDMGDEILLSWRARNGLTFTYARQVRGLPDIRRIRDKFKRGTWTAPYVVQRLATYYPAKPQRSE